MRPLFSPSPLPLAKDSLFGRRRRERLKKASESFELAKQQVARIFIFFPSSAFDAKSRIPHDDTDLEKKEQMDPHCQ